MMLVAGCTSSSHKNKKSGSPSGTTTSSTAPAKPTITAASSIPPPTGNVVPLFKTVQLTKCAAVSGGWQAAGTIHNTTGQAHEYQILVYFTTNQATVIDSATTSVQVADNQSADWQAGKQFNTEPNMRCVIVSVK